MKGGGEEEGIGWAGRNGWVWGGDECIEILPGGFPRLIISKLHPSYQQHTFRHKDRSDLTWFTGPWGG